MNANPIDTLFEAGLLSEIDLAFARLIARISGLEGETADRLSILSAMLSRTCTGDKSVRLELRSLSQEGVAALFAKEELRPSSEKASAVKESIALFYGVGAKDWFDVLKTAAKVATPTGDGQSLKPIVYDEASGSIYLLRLWLAERRVSGGILQRTTAKTDAGKDSLDLIEKLFPLYGEPPKGEADLQKEAAKTVASGSLSIITGGPGTGKTSSVAAALCALLAAEPQLRIGLCAPTGKAAAQLLASIESQKDLFRSKGIPEITLGRLPSEALTIHRLLQWSPAQERYLRNAENKLDLDALVVDEASMMSLSQADSLLAATPENARLILLGDKDQLASVESGSVFADICAKSGEAFALSPHVAELKKVHRFKEGGAIATLKDAINRQRPEEAWEALAKGSSEVNLICLDSASPAKMRERLGAELRRVFEAGRFKDYLKESDPEKAFKLFDSLRVLCSNRRGVFGVESVNAMLLDFVFGHRAAEASKGLPGLPVIVTRNNYSVGLNNGDVGLVLPAQGVNSAYFRDGEEGFKSCPLPLLPEHELAFAMTVHKAQGSGFDHALVVLPPDPLNMLLTKELLYTAVTRAKSKLTVICSEEAFKIAVMRRTERSSGLAKTLGGA